MYKVHDDMDREELIFTTTLYMSAHIFIGLAANTRRPDSPGFSLGTPVETFPSPQSQY